MHRLFPDMTDRPAGRTVAGGAIFWPVYTIVLPFFISVLLTETEGEALWILMLYGSSFLAVALIFRKYLIESFTQVRWYPGRFCAVVGVSACVTFAVELLLVWLCTRSWNMEVAYASMNLLPVAELPLGVNVSIAMMEMPVWMTICSCVFVPGVMCCLYYGVGFAPAAVERPWLGYVIVLVLAAVPRLLGLGNMGFPMYQLMVYLLQLPYHLLACWAYQKADTIWAPICMYALVNFLSCLAANILYCVL